MTRESRAARPSVLVVDDDPGVRFTLAEVLGEADVDVLKAAGGEEALALLAAHAGEVHLVLTDLAMPGLDGMELLRRIRAEHPAVLVVMITAHGSEAHAVAAMKLGAYDYFAKPFDVEAVLAVVRRATAAVRLDLENQRLRAELALARHMIFRSPAMALVAEFVDRVARKDVTVLLAGESGTGKELVADALCAASHRAGRPFLKFNCAALPAELAEAELFGHSAGAFTGAVRARPGLFRQADTGTLFLDEVGELDPAVQGKLLRVLQTGEVKPLGEDQTRRVDVRLIAATHRDLSAETAAGRFREDLFYRLHVVVIQLPPLRERREDIDPLIDHFLALYSARFSLPGCTLAPAVRAELQAREYRGNVRELQNLCERIVALSGGGLIESLEGTAGGAPPGEPGSLGLRERVEAFERSLIVEALERAQGNRSEAARQLRIGRVTLLDKLKKYGL